MHLIARLLRRLADSNPDPSPRTRVIGAVLVVWVAASLVVWWIRMP